MPKFVDSARPRNLTVRLQGRRWRVVFKVDPQNWGTCDSDARVIEVAPNADDPTTIMAVVHEMTHARFPDLSEEAVEEFADACGDVLARLGFRRCGCEQDD